MRPYTDHLILADSKITVALIQLDKLAQDAILFVVDHNDKLIGALTDGDIRRGLIKGITVDNSINTIIQKNPKYIRKGENNLAKIIEYRDGNFKIVPVINHEDKILNIINFRLLKSYLPVDVVIMAGGRGQRLQPLTDTVPKPMLKIGNKPIIEHNIDRLIKYGIDDIWITVKYLGEKIEEYLGNGNSKNINIEYIWENEACGTIGSVSKIDNFKHDYVLITNSDLLTKVNYEHFFLEFIKQGADIAILTIPYNVSIPYAVLETEGGKIKDFKEKPTYTYYSNGGMYLVKKELLKMIPKDIFYDATDFMSQILANKLNIISYPFSGYWLDVGKHEDFEKAQVDIHNLNF